MKTKMCENARAYTLGLRETRLLTHKLVFPLPGFPNMPVKNDLFSNGSMSLLTKHVSHLKPGGVSPAIRGFGISRMRMFLMVLDNDYARVLWDLHLAAVLELILVNHTRLFLFRLLWLWGFAASAHHYQIFV